MARPETRSIAALTGKDIAIDGPPTEASDIVRTAIVAAGAVEVQLKQRSSKGGRSADKRRGCRLRCWPLVSPEAADWFPEIAGFRIFRVPLKVRY